jgi:hypothetical protein
MRFVVDPNSNYFAYPLDSQEDETYEFQINISFQLWVILYTNSTKGLAIFPEK